MNYFFVLSNLFIVLLFIFQYIKNRQWFIRIFIIGKLIQLCAIFLLELGLGEPNASTKVFVDILLTVGIPFEIFGIISYQGNFSKKKMYLLITASSIFVAFYIISDIVAYHNPQIINITLAFYFLFGGVSLLKIKDLSKFRYIIGSTFLIYSLLHVAKLFFINAFPEPGQMPPPLIPEPGMHGMPGMLGPGPQKPIFEIAFSDMVNFVSIVSGLGLIIILKELDEIKLATLNKKISSENINLKKVDEEKNKFFSIIAHDLKGPLATVTGISELLIEKRGNLTEEDYEMWIGHINQSLNQILNLLNNLLFWARSQSGNLKPNPENINIKTICDEAVQLLAIIAENKNIKLKNHCPGDVEIFADKDMILTAIRNLISNAIKFTNQDGEIIINAENNNPALISITDNGVGMSKKIIDQLFKLDTRITTPGTHEEEGSGLGLKLVHEFVTKNKGNIWVKSKEAEGSTFFLSLPCA